MNTEMRKLSNSLKRLWTRFWDHLDRRAEQHVAAWGSALQYKRRYTNTDAAKSFRRPVEDLK